MTGHIGASTYSTTLTMVIILQITSSFCKRQHDGCPYYVQQYCTVLASIETESYSRHSALRCGLCNNLLHVVWQGLNVTVWNLSNRCNIALCTCSPIQVDGAADTCNRFSEFVLKAIVFDTLDCFQDVHCYVRFLAGNLCQGKATASKGRGLINTISFWKHGFRNLSIKVSA